MAYCVFQSFSRLSIILWLSPLITGNTEEPDLLCIASLIMPRNTVWIAPEMETLRINCTVESSPPCWKEIIKSVYWCRLDHNQCTSLNYSSHIKTEWKTIDSRTGISFLTFQNISIKDSGLYRCGVNMSSPTISHSANVTVTDNFLMANVTSEVVCNITSTDTSFEYLLRLWPYMCSGIVVSVVVVLVLLIRCKRKKESQKERGDKKAENQSAASQISDPALPVHDIEVQNSFSHDKTHSLSANLNSSTCVYDNVPVRLASHREAKRPTKGGASIQSHDKLEEEKEEETTLIYASLNQTAVPQRPVRVNYTVMEASEYAAIKVS